MKKHSEMRPQDIVVLLKIVSKGHLAWKNKDLAHELSISQSEITESLYRSIRAGLISEDKKVIMKKALLDFLRYGLRYVYPEHPGAIVRGMATAHSAKPLSDIIQSDDNYVWPLAEGKIRGQSIQPLYPTVPVACLKDEKLYALISLTDALRVGRIREQNLAIEELEKLIK